MIDFLIEKDWWKWLALALLIFLWLLFVLRAAWQNRKIRKQRDFDRKLETVLQPRETVKAVCPQKKGRCILTSKRLLWETAAGFSAVPLKDIKRVQGVTAEGKNTSSVPKMVRMTVKAEEERSIYNVSEDFALLAKALQDKVRKQNQRKTK